MVVNADVARLVTSQPTVPDQNKINTLMIGDDDNKKIIMFTRGRCFVTSKTTALSGSSMDGWVHDEDNRGNQ